MALGALIIQTKFQYFDRVLMEQIAENPYLRYFIGFPGYQEETPFEASTLELFCKRISAEMLMEGTRGLLREILFWCISMFIVWAKWRGNN